MTKDFVPPKLALLAIWLLFLRLVTQLLLSADSSRLLQLCLFQQKPPADLSKPPADKLYRFALVKKHCAATASTAACAAFTGCWGTHSSAVAGTWVVDTSFALIWRQFIMCAFALGAFFSFAIVEESLRCLASLFGVRGYVHERGGQLPSAQTR
jgi:hypothetical protein